MNRRELMKIAGAALVSPVAIGTNSATVKVTGAKILRLNIQFILPDAFNGTRADALRLLAQYVANPTSHPDGRIQEDRGWPDMSVREHADELKVELLRDHAKYGARFTGGVACRRWVDGKWANQPLPLP